MKSDIGYWLIPAVLSVVLLSGCSRIDIHDAAPPQPGQSWMLLPLQNLSDTPKAGENARELLANSLRGPGMPVFRRFVEQPEDGDLPELSEQRREDQALAWGKQQGVGYALGGAVNEWRYKPGTGEPVLGITLKVVDLRSGNVIWSASGSRSGWAGSTASGTAQQLLDQMVSKVDFN
ncbi:hypothetical protein [Methyloterricola oryzae]|uniref:hypothetical protein n=1 Tax=Methyloterricola oryzae TaxID=1495050 RepID=UPI00069B2B2B|nr:hypothetical protein [Methyloterricola oryzae]